MIWRKSLIAVLFVFAVLGIKLSGFVAPVEDWRILNHPSYLRNFELGFKMLDSGKHPYGLPGFYQKPIFLKIAYNLPRVEVQGIELTFLILNTLLMLGFASMFSSLMGSSKKNQLVLFASIVLNPLTVTVLKI